MHAWCHAGVRKQLIKGTQPRAEGPWSSAGLLNGTNILFGHTHAPTSAFYGEMMGDTCLE